jgi:hypothetical protein
VNPRHIAASAVLATAVATASAVAVLVASGDESATVAAPAPPPGRPLQPAQPEVPAPAPPPAPVIETKSPEQRAALGAAVSAAVDAAASGTDMGLVVYDRVANAPIASVAGDERFHTASVAKLLVALDVLHRNAWQLPDQRTRQQLECMLSLNDDGIASALWKKNGDTAIVERMADLVKLDHTRPPTQPELWEITSSTPNDIAAIYRFIENDIPDEASAFILGALHNAPERASDGFYQHFGIPEALPGVYWAAKQGWMVSRSALVLNTTGVVGPDGRYVVVLLTKQPKSTGYAEGRDAVTAGIRALAPHLT